ncbi:hypothetical protein SB748_35820, partial [Rhizobium sp. SIMBA_035]
MIRLPLVVTSACMASLLVVATAASAQTSPSAATPETGRLHAADQAFITDATKAVSTQRDAARIAASRSTD